MLLRDNFHYKYSSNNEIHMKIQDLLNDIFKWIIAPVVLLWLLISLLNGDKRSVSDILISIWDKVEESIS